MKNVTGSAKFSKVLIGSLFNVSFSLLFTLLHPLVSCSCSLFSLYCHSHHVFAFHSRTYFYIVSTFLHILSFSRPPSISSSSLNLSK